MPKTTLALRWQIRCSIELQIFVFAQKEQIRCSSHLSVVHHFSDQQELPCLLPTAFKNKTNQKQTPQTARGSVKF